MKRKTGKVDYSTTLHLYSRIKETNANAEEAKRLAMREFRLRLSVDQARRFIEDSIVITDVATVRRAARFAIESHGNQRRKYTGEPYWFHCAQVAGIVCSAGQTFPGISVLYMQAISWLHDVLEDTQVTQEELRREFGPEIYAGVLALSDLEGGNRAERQAAARRRLADANALVQTVKVADLLSNSSSILKLDPAFATVYVPEKVAMLNCLTKADHTLLQQAWRVIDEYDEYNKNRGG